MESKKKLDSLKKFWSNKKIFITGHTGFKGSWLSIILNLLGAKLYGYSLKPKKKSLFNQSGIGKNFISNFYGDIDNFKLLSEKIKKSKPNIIFHLAAQPLVIDSYKHPIKTFRTNIFGTLNLLESLKKVKSVKSVLIITTDKVYKINKSNKPYVEQDQLGGSDPYSTSKVGAEIVTHTYIKSFFKNNFLKNKISTVRAGNVIGGGDYSENRLVPDIIKAINNRRKIIIRNPNHVRPWQYVIEPLVGYLTLAERQYKTNIKTKNFAWNFGPNKNNFKSVISIVKKIKNIENFKYSIKKINRLKETKILKLNSNKSKKILKWLPIWNLNETLKMVLEWNMLIKKGKNVKEVCKNQFLMYIKRKK